MSNEYDLSIVIPALRDDVWPVLYESVGNACKKYKWELVLVSPFPLPVELQDKENITLIRDFGNVTRCVQLGVQQAKGDLFFLTVDDCVFAKDSIDMAMDKYYSDCGYKDVIAMIYAEDGNAMPKEYWTVAGPPGRPDIGAPLNLPGIDRSWKIANQCLMKRQYFIDLGGVDCENFVYLDKPIHDFMFRLQRDGGNIYFSPKHVCLATHFPQTSGDHKPIHNACARDAPYFNMLYSNPSLYENRVKISFDNWRRSDKIWKGRFTKGIPKSYRELCVMEGYNLHQIEQMKEKLRGLLECELKSQ